jgi:ADP-ribose pyrophosphatase
MKHLKKISEETVHTNPWWTYKHERFEKANGEAGDYYYAETHGVSIVVPVLSDGSIVLTRQYRYLFDKESIEFPGGGIKEGSDALETARQELYEETGWIADEFAQIGTFEPANGYVKDLTHVYLARADEQQEQQLEDTEEIEVIYRRPDEIDEMVRRNDIWDGQSLAVWSLVRGIFFKELTGTESPTLQNMFKSFFDTNS